MKQTDIFYQGEGIPDLDHIEIDSEANFGQLKKLLIEKHGCKEDLRLFIEDEEEQVNDNDLIKGKLKSHGLKVHLHRCRHVEVSVTFNNQTVTHQFGPGVTVGRVKNWFATKKFGMDKDEAGEHVLQITGSTDDRPKPGTHLGSLVSCPNCNIAFDLVPNQRVNGALEAWK